MMTIARWLLSVMIIFAGAPVAAQEGEAYALVKDVTEKVLSILREDEHIRRGDTQRAAGLIEEHIAPHFDFPRITALAVGRAWAQSDAAQREALTKEFRELLVRTYSNALAQYKDQTVRFRPMRQGQDPGEAIVHSQIEQAGGRPVALDYRLSKDSGEWKVIDVSVANVSLVTSYRSSFASEVRKGGVDGLLKALQAKNREAQPAAPPGEG